LDVFVRKRELARASCVVSARSACPDGKARARHPRSRAQLGGSVRRQRACSRPRTRDSGHETGAGGSRTRAARSRSWRLDGGARRRGLDRSSRGCLPTLAPGPRLAGSQGRRCRVERVRPRRARPATPLAESTVRAWPRSGASGAQPATRRPRPALLGRGVRRRVASLRRHTRSTSCWPGRRGSDRDPRRFPGPCGARPRQSHRGRDAEGERDGRPEDGEELRRDVRERLIAPARDPHRRRTSAGLSVPAGGCRAAAGEGRAPDCAGELRPAVHCRSAHRMPGRRPRTGVCLRATRRAGFGWSSGSRRAATTVHAGW